MARHILSDIISADKAIHGESEWMSKFAVTVGVSKQLMAAIVAGDRPVTANTIRLIAKALRLESENMRVAAARLDAIADRFEAIRKEK